MGYVWRAVADNDSAVNVDSVAGGRDAPGKGRGWAPREPSVGGLIPSLPDASNGIDRTVRGRLSNMGRKQT
jgi:hypothetical protein